MKSKKILPFDNRGLIIAVVLLIAVVGIYRVFRLRYVIKHIISAPEDSSTAHSSKNARIPHLGLKAYSIYKDGKDYMVFYRPLGFSRPQNLSSQSRGEDMVYLTTEILLKSPSHLMRAATIKNIFEELLLKEITSEERQAGFYTLVPAGARIRGVSFSKEDGVLTLDFDKKFSSLLGGGSLAMSQARLAIEEVARQFPEEEVKNVQILVEGKKFSFEP